MPDPVPDTDRAAGPVLAIHLGQGIGVLVVNVGLRIGAHAEAVCTRVRRRSRIASADAAATRAILPVEISLGPDVRFFVLALYELEILVRRGRPVSGFVLLVNRERAGELE